MWVSVGKTPCSLSINSRWDWTVGSSSCRFTTRREPRVLMRCDVVWNPQPVWLRRRKECWCVCQERICSCPVYSQSLYLLRYFGNGECRPVSIRMRWQRKAPLPWQESKPGHVVCSQSLYWQNNLSLLGGMRIFDAHRLRSSLGCYAE
jgi:hypothetical protein